jgi:hypothetical protein
MAMIDDLETPVSKFLQGAREKSGSEVDYSNLLIAVMAQVLSTPLGSARRVQALSDLHDLLTPFQDERFKTEWLTLNGSFLDAEPNGGHSDGLQAMKWQRAHLVLLIRLMKREGMLPLGMI